MADAKVRFLGKDNVSPAAKKANKGLSSFAKTTLKAAVSIAALTKGISAAASAFAAQEKAETKLNQTVISTGGAAGITAKRLVEMATALHDVTTFGDEAIIAAQSLLLTFTNIGKDVFPEAIKTVLDLSVGMGQDLKSSVVQLGKALNDPIKGVTALSRVGVQLTEVQIDQIKSFVKLGQTADAQRIILSELNTQFGGQAQADAKTYSGQITQMGNAFGDLLESLTSLVVGAGSPFGLLNTFIPGLTKSFAFLSRKRRPI